MERVRRGLKPLPGVKGVSRGFLWLQGVTRGSRVLHAIKGVTGGYKG